MDTIDLTANANVAAALLSAMANPKGLLILCNLVKGEIPVGALAQRVGLSQSGSLAAPVQLRAQKLVKTRRDAQTIYYSSNFEPVLRILEALTDIYAVQSRAKSAA